MGGVLYSHRGKDYSPLPEFPDGVNVGEGWFVGFEHALYDDSTALIKPVQIDPRFYNDGNYVDVDKVLRLGEGAKGHLFVNHQLYYFCHEKLG